MLLNPTFPDKELERLRGQTLATIQQEKAQPAAIISRVCPKLLFGEGHAYSNPASGTGTEEAVTQPQERRTRRVLQALGAARQFDAAGRGRHHARSRSSRCSSSASAAGARRPKPLPKKNIADVALAAKPRVFLIDRPGAEQSQILAATVGPTRADADHIRFVALDTHARRQLRLAPQHEPARGQALVVRRAARASPMPIGQGTFRAGGGVQTDKTAESMVEIRKELRDVIGSRKPDDAELKFAQGQHRDCAARQQRDLGRDRRTPTARS